MILFNLAWPWACWYSLEAPNRPKFKTFESLMLFYQHPHEVTWTAFKLLCLLRVYKYIYFIFRRILPSLLSTRENYCSYSWGLFTREEFSLFSGKWKQNYILRRTNLLCAALKKVFFWSFSRIILNLHTWFNVIQCDKKWQNFPLLIHTQDSNPFLPFFFVGRDICRAFPMITFST